MVKSIYKLITDFCNFYKDICLEDYSENDLKCSNKVATTLCRLEIILLSSFFGMMEHLTIHLFVNLVLPIRYNIDGVDEKIVRRQSSFWLTSFSEKFWAFRKIGVVINRQGIFGTTTHRGYFVF